MANANPYPYGGAVAPDPSAKMQISIFLPLNNSVYNTDNINFSAKFWCPESDYATGSHTRSVLLAVYYSIDSQQRKTIYYRSASGSPDPINPLSYFEELNEIPDGNHTITVFAEGSCIYPPGGYPHFYNDSGLHPYYSFTISNSTTVSFSVYTHPAAIAIISLQNRTFSTNTLPLDFAVNRTVSWSAYSLDNQDNVTITGNTTLTGLPDGPHSVTIYANDTAGNMGKSETVFFSVILPRPTASPTNSLYPSPTLLDSPDTVLPLQNWVTGWAASWLVIIIVFAGVVGALIYIRKRRKRGL